MALWSRSSPADYEDEFFGVDQVEWIEKMSDDDNNGVVRNSNADAGGGGPAGQERHPKSLIDGRDWCRGEDGLAARDTAAIAEQHRALGYHETYDLSQEETSQAGFADGYRDTFEAAARIGTLLGQRAAASTLLPRRRRRHPTLAAANNLSPAAASSPPPPPVDDDENDPDVPYLAAARRIREVLLLTTAASTAEQDPQPPPRQLHERGDTNAASVRRGRGVDNDDDTDVDGNSTTAAANRTPPQLQQQQQREHEQYQLRHVLEDLEREVERLLFKGIDTEGGAGELG